MSDKNGIDIFGKCCICSTKIKTRQIYWTCSVSTCNKKRSPSYFCSVKCWDVHLPVANHKSAWAEEQVAVRKKIISGPTPQTNSQFQSKGTPPPQSFGSTSGVEKDILIVASKLKNYVKNKSGMNTSQNCLNRLSDIVREITDQAINEAKKQGRRTVMDRDFK